MVNVAMLTVDKLCTLTQMFPQNTDITSWWAPSVAFGQNPSRWPVDQVMVGNHGLTFFSALLGICPVSL